MKEWNEEKNIAEQEPERGEHEDDDFSGAKFKRELKRARNFTLIGLSFF